SGKKLHPIPPRPRPTIVVINVYILTSGAPFEGADGLEISRFHRFRRFDIYEKYHSIYISAFSFSFSFVFREIMEKTANPNELCAATVTTIQIHWKHALLASFVFFSVTG